MFSKIRDVVWKFWWTLPGIEIFYKISHLILSTWSFQILKYIVNCHCDIFYTRFCLFFPGKTKSPMSARVSRHVINNYECSQMSFSHTISDSFVSCRSRTFASEKIVICGWENTSIIDLCTKAALELWMSTKMRFSIVHCRDNWKNCVRRISDVVSDNYWKGKMLRVKKNFHWLKGKLLLEKILHDSSFIVSWKIHERTKIAFMATN